VPVRAGKPALERTWCQVVSQVVIGSGLGDRVRSGRSSRAQRRRLLRGCGCVPAGTGSAGRGPVVARVRRWQHPGPGPGGGGWPGPGFGTESVDHVGRPGRLEIANPLGALAVRMAHDPTVVGPRHDEEEVSIRSGLATADDDLLDRAEAQPSPDDPHKSSRRGQEQQAEDRGPERRAPHIHKGVDEGRIVRFRAGYAVPRTSVIS
jgi:hypothetical protein